VAGSSTPAVTLYWENGATTAGGSGIVSIASADLHIAEWYDNAGFKWNDEGAGSITGTTTTGTITTSAVPVFVSGTSTPFTLSAPTAINPLPIELLSFTGKAESNGNLLTWSTASEINNDYFELERSGDAVTFIKTGTVEGQGNSSVTTNYDFLDDAPLAGMNYYRLKQTDFNGDYTYSGIIMINNTRNEEAFVLAYPNPATGSQINIMVSDNISSVTVYNLLGEIIFSSGTLSSKEVKIDIFAKGVYVIKAMNKNNELITSKFTKE
jgi:hypothetical protein